MAKRYKFTNKIIGEKGGDWAFWAKGKNGGGFLVTRKTRAKARKARKWYELKLSSGELE